MSSDDPKDGNERRERGLRMFEEVYGGIVPVPPPEQRHAFFNQTVDQLFAEVWSRPNLPVRDKRLVTLGAVAALGEAEMFEIQLRAALRKGELTPAQVEELVLFLPAYVSYPRTSKLLAISQKLLAELVAADAKEQTMDEGFFRSYYEAYNSADPERLRLFLADDVVLESAAGVQQGVEAYLGTYRWITGAFIDQMTPTSIELTGDGAVVHILDRFTAKQDVPDFLGRNFKAGDRFEMRIVGRYRVKDGRIAHIDIAMA